MLQCFLWWNASRPCALCLLLAALRRLAGAYRARSLRGRLAAAALTRTEPQRGEALLGAVPTRFHAASLACLLLIGQPFRVLRRLRALFSSLFCVSVLQRCRVPLAARAPLEARRLDRLRCGFWHEMSPDREEPWGGATED